jgi:hypothetical protein
MWVLGFNADAPQSIIGPAAASAFSRCLPSVFVFLARNKEGCFAF